MIAQVPVPTERLRSSAIRSEAPAAPDHTIFAIAHFKLNLFDYFFAQKKLSLVYSMPFDWRCTSLVKHIADFVCSMIL